MTVTYFTPKCTVTKRRGTIFVHRFQLMTLETFQAVKFGSSKGGPGASAVSWGGSSPVPSRSVDVRHEPRSGWLASPLQHIRTSFHEITHSSQMYTYIGSTCTHQGLLQRRSAGPVRIQNDSGYYAWRNYSDIEHREVSAYLWRFIPIRHRKRRYLPRRSGDGVIRALARDEHQHSGWGRG